MYGDHDAPLTQPHALLGSHSIGVLLGIPYSRASPRSSVLRSAASVRVVRKTMLPGKYDGDVAL
ncbi:hypothetical protein HETIRDRAFT_408011, partial [Heterobasidion irregulare TC 32-1]